MVPLNLLSNQIVKASVTKKKNLQNVRCFICQELTGSSHTKEYTTENVRCLLSYDLQFPKNYQI